LVSIPVDDDINFWLGLLTPLFPSWFAEKPVDDEGSEEEEEEEEYEDEEEYDEEGEEEEEEEEGGEPVGGGEGAGAGDEEARSLFLLSLWFCGVFVVNITRFLLTES
jgi:hypothetical protein